jgi:hypothetical protein
MNRRSAKVGLHRRQHCARPENRATGKPRVGRMASMAAIVAFASPVRQNLAGTLGGSHSPGRTR